MRLGLREWIGILVLISCFILQSLYLIRTTSTVSDEVAHIVAGYSYLKFDDFRLNSEHPPFAKQLGALPLIGMSLKFPDNSSAWQSAEQWTLGRDFLFSSGNPAETIIIRSRIAMLSLGILLGLLIFLASFDFFGIKAAFFSLGLFAFFPDLIAHSGLVATDFPAAVFFFATFYFLIRYQRTEQIKWVAASGIAAGLAIISKFSMILILPLFYGFALLTVFIQEGKKTPISIHLAWIILAFAFAVTHKLSILIFAFPLAFLLLARYFPHPGHIYTPASKNAVSILFILLTCVFVVIAIDYFEFSYWFEKFRPFKRFFRGWEIFRGHSISREHLGYLLGEWSTKGWWYYYLAGMLVKIPIPILLSGFIGGVYLCRTKQISWQQKWLFAIPPLFFLAIASFVNSVNIGVRHVLPIFPFLVVLAGGAVPCFDRSRIRFISSLISLIIVLWTAREAKAAFPNYLSYFNQFALLFGGGDKILSDSNISWGQDIKRLKKDLDHHRDGKIYFISLFNSPEELRYYDISFEEGSQPLAEKRQGTYIMSIHDYHLFLRDSAFQWLSEIKPARKVGDSLLVFKILAAPENSL